MQFPLVAMQRTPIIVHTGNKSIDILINWKS